ncbi:hypothetical protein [Methanobrevibacter sp.]|uniref:hypothetical protein n=1 Tax=Methanobrevibacter sp. TaxID=66852 RepID=UPI0025EB24C0|nr:hypothetical protein [Methanobrevibacter sp.]MBR4448534.1 hypothetical protein [Methanobrevibacter sp.]
MINSLVTVVQLIVILISLALVLYTLLIRGDNNRSSYIMFLLNLCLLWMLLI